MDTTATQHIRIPWRAYICPATLALVIFLLQARHLHEVAVPNTDEGVYAEAGRMFFQGYSLYVDIPLWHMPLLPLLIGSGLKLFGNMFALRVLYLFFNCVVSLLFFIVLFRISNKTIASVVGVFFYLTYHEMVHHDFRFLAIRQLANGFFILFLLLGLNSSKENEKEISWQSTSAIFSVFLFLPSILNLFLASLALVFNQQSTMNRLYKAKRYLIILSIASLTACIFLIFVPQAFQSVIANQAMRGGSARLPRLLMLFQCRPDNYLYSLAILGLIMGLFFRESIRWFSLSMLLVIVLSVLLPTSYYPHYPVIAGPAFAFGATVLVSALQDAINIVSKQRFVMPTTICVVALLIAPQIYFVFGSLWREWDRNISADYYLLIDVLARMPDPVLALEPIYAVDANRTPLRQLIHAYMREPVAYSPEEYGLFAQQACTILLEGKANWHIPQKTIDSWKEHYTHRFENSAGLILSTGKASCSTLN